MPPPPTGSAAGLGRRWWAAPPCRLDCLRRWRARPRAAPGSAASSRAARPPSRWWRSAWWAAGWRRCCWSRSCSRSSPASWSASCLHRRRPSRTGRRASAQRRPSRKQPARPAARGPLSRLGRREVPAEHLHRAAVLLGRAELDPLGPRRHDRDVAGGRVVGVAALVDLLAIGVLERHLPADHVAPVRALAAVVGQSLEQRRRVGVLAERLEPDHVAAELLVAPLHHAHVLDLRGRLLRGLRHFRLPSVVDTESRHSVYT